MYRLILTPSTKSCGWGTVTSNTCCNWKPEFCNVLGFKPIITDQPTPTLLEDDAPGKRPKIENGMLFELLSINIVNVIDDWLIDLEHYKTLNIIVERIKSPHSPVLNIHKHQHWVPYLYFGNHLIYKETNFHWEDRYYVKTPCSFGPDTQLIKHNNK